MTTSERFWPIPNVADHSGGKGTMFHKGLNPTLKGAVLTSSPADSPASPSLPQASAKANLMTAISGRNLRELFDVLDPVGLCLRMCRESSVWRVGLTGYSLTWIRSATPQGRSFYRLRLSAPTTVGIGSGSLPTMFQSPMPSDVDGRRTTKGSGRQNETGVRRQAMFGTPMANNKVRSAKFAEGRTPNLREVEKEAQMWPTPRHEGFDAGAHRGEPDSLHSAVKMLHTPTSKANQLSLSMAERDAGSYGHVMLPTAAASDSKGSSQEGQRRGQLSEVVAGQKLSAAWVSRLMGYPDGWMDDVPPDPLGGGPASPEGSRQIGKKASRE